MSKQVEMSSMNSVCIIGNSHAASIKIAMRKKKITNIDIYGSGGQSLNSLKQSENTLILNNNSTTFFSNSNPACINLCQYGEIIIYGCQLISRAGGGIWLNNYYDSISGNYSDTCIQALNEQELYNSLSLRIAQLIKSSEYTGKITIMPSPLPNENHPHVNPEAGQDSPEILRAVCKLYQEIFQEMNIEFKALPETLLAKNNFTCASKYLNNRASGEDDFVHLNSDGSFLVLNEMLK